MKSQYIHFFDAYVDSIILHHITIWLFNIAMERSTMFKNGKPSIFMGHGFHGYVKLPEGKSIPYYDSNPYNHMKSYEISIQITHDSIILNPPEVDYNPIQSH